MPGSTHGYDVTDPTRLNPEIGDERAYARGSQRCARAAWGTSSTSCRTTWASRESANPWWQDVLENGPSSRYAPIFDIDWHPLKPELEDKVLLPVLGDTYGAVLERQEIQLEYDDGAFRARYFDHALPDRARHLRPRARHRRRRAAATRSARTATTGIEFLSILTAIRHLPGQDGPRAGAARRTRPREGSHQAAARRADRPRRRACCAHIERAVTAFNGAHGDPRSFDASTRCSSARPIGWRTGASPPRRSTTGASSTSTSWRRSGWKTGGVRARARVRLRAAARADCVDGFRIDHVDGLLRSRRLPAAAAGAGARAAPDRYSASGRFYLVVEKILGVDEELPTWPVEGTTGYDFLVAAQRAVRRLSATSARSTSVYERFTRMRAPFREIAYRGKQLVLRVSMASELNVLAHGSTASPSATATTATSRSTAWRTRCARSSRASPSTGRTSTTASRSARAIARTSSTRCARPSAAIPNRPAARLRLRRATCC